MNIQLYIVILIGIMVSFVVLRGVYRFFFNKKSPSGFCGSCSECEFNPQNIEGAYKNGK